jgi:acyl dehydratase
MSEPRVLLGQVSGPWEGTIDAGHARAYALATNDPTPAYFDDGVVPPLMTVAMALDLLVGSMDKGVPAGAIRNRKGGVHGTHEVHLTRPILAGQALRGTAEVVSATQTPAGAMVSHRVSFTDPDGGPLVDHYYNLFSMGAEVDPVGPPLPDHSFPEEARAHRLGSISVPTSEDQTFRYAGASFDHAMIHMHDSAAQRNGMPKKFLQGLCTLAFCSRAVFELATDGDPRPLRRLACRFSSPVYPGDPVEIEVFDAGPLADGRRGVAFEATSAGKTVIKHGWAELADG